MSALGPVCTFNILWSPKDSSRIIIDNSKAKLQILASLTDDFRSVIYNPKGVIFDVYRTGINDDDCHMTMEEHILDTYAWKQLS